MRQTAKIFWTRVWDGIKPQLTKKKKVNLSTGGLPEIAGGIGEGVPTHVKRNCRPM